MYTLVTAVLKDKNSNKPWAEINISQMPVREFTSRFISGYVVLTNNHLTGEQIVDYKTFLQAALPYPFVNITFTSWLALIGDRILPTVKEPSFSYGEAWYSNSCKAGWRIERAHPTSPSNENYTPAELTDALLTKPGVSMQEHGKYILVTQNGLLHLCYPTDRGLHVKNLTESFYSSNKNSVGLLSMTDIGEVTQIPVTLNNLTAVDDTDNYMREFFVDTNMDLTNKTVWISIGGYLHTSTKEVSVVNNEAGTVAVNLKTVDIPRRIAHSSQLIDLSSLGIFQPDFSPTLFDLKELKTRVVMQRYLTLSQTFVIVINSQNVEVVEEAVEYRGIVGNYKTPLRRSYAIFNQYGLFQYYQPSKLDNERMGVMIPADIHSYNDYDTTNWTRGPTYGEDYRLRFGDRYPALTVKRIKSTDMVFTSP